MSKGADMEKLDKSIEQAKNLIALIDQNKQFVDAGFMPASSMIALRDLSIYLKDAAEEIFKVSNEQAIF